MSNVLLSPLPGLTTLLLVITLKIGNQIVKPCSAYQWAFMPSLGYPGLGLAHHGGRLTFL